MNMKPAFRFGVNSSPRSASAIGEFARKLEAGGFSILLTPDGPSHGAAVFPLLTVAASATTTLHVGTYVVANDLHHPFHLAHNAATLQTLNGGRFELGLGAGRPGMDAEYDALGLTISSPGKRLARLERSASIIRALFRGETVNESGDDYVMTNAKLPAWLTETSPPPVLIAGTGPRLLDMATKTADIVALGAAPTASWEELQIRFDRIAELARERETPPVVNMTFSGVGNRLSHWASRMPEEMQENLLNSDSPSVLKGSTDDMIEGIHRRNEQFGATYFVFPEDLVDAAIPVVKHFASQVRV